MDASFHLGRLALARLFKELVGQSRISMITETPGI